MTIDNQDPNEELHQDDLAWDEPVPWQLTGDVEHGKYVLHGVVKEVTKAVKEVTKDE